VDSMVEGRVVLEKIKVLEGRMRYQIEKLVRVAEAEPSSSSQNVIDGIFSSLCFISYPNLIPCLHRSSGLPAQSSEPNE